MQAAIAMGVAANAAAAARVTPPRAEVAGAVPAPIVSAAERAVVASRSPPASDPVPVPKAAAGHPRSHPDGPPVGSQGPGGIHGQSLK